MEEGKSEVSEVHTPAPSKSGYTSLGRHSVERPDERPAPRATRRQLGALVRHAGGSALILGIVLSLVAAAAMIATTPPASGTVLYGLPQPEVRRSVGGRLKTRLRVAAGADDQGVVARRYGRRTPGPTLLVKPGDAVTVTLENDLGPEAPGDALRTGLRHPNTTTLHAHGWHVSPREDDVFTLVPPGATRTYPYHLPASHPAGTFWYHAHAQGSSSVQIQGMVGALVVLEADHRRLPPDVVMLLTQTNLVAGKARNYAWATAASGSRIAPLAKGGMDGTPAEFAASLKKRLAPPLNASFFAVNGRYRPTLRPKAGDWLRWRLVNAGSNDVLALSLDDEGACATRVVARDGYARAAPLEGRLTRKRPLVLAPGSRADVYAACARPAVLRSRAKGLEGYLGAGSDVHDGVVLRVKPDKLDRPICDPPPPPPPAAMASLLGATPDRVATLEMLERGPVLRDGNDYTDYGFDVVAGDGTVRVGDVVEWTVVNARKGPGGAAAQDTTHPFHLHTNHYQIVTASHGLGVDFDVGDWRDTITLPTPGNVTVRFRAADFDGPSLAHCHIFSHADLGMDHPVNILPAL